MSTALSLDGVSKRYGDFHAVRDVSFSVPAGRICGFLGPNGAGKTSTIRMALGLIEPSAGQITVLGSDDARKVRDRIGFLPEERGLYKRMTPIDAIAFFAGLKGVADGEARKRAKVMLEAQGLGPFMTKPIQALSKGMAQKVQLLSALAHEPELVVLDEPFSGLDPVNQQALEAMIRDIAARGATVLFSTHVMQHAERLCDRVVLMARGRKVFDGDVAEARRAAPRASGAGRRPDRRGGRGPAGDRRGDHGDPARRLHALHRHAGARRRRPGGAEGRLRPRPRPQAVRGARAQPARRLHRPDRRPGMSRLLRIARREYLAYVRTAGFWLSILALPLVMGVSISAPMMMMRSAQPERLAIVDLTGQGLGEAVGAARRGPGPRRRPRPASRGHGGRRSQGRRGRQGGARPGRGGRRPRRPGQGQSRRRRPLQVAQALRRPPAAPADTLKAADPKAAGAAMRREIAARELDTGLILSGRDDAIVMDLWSRNLAAPVLENELRGDVRDIMRQRALTRAGVDAATLKAADDLKPTLNSLSPKAASGEKISLRDRLPTYVGLAMGFLLWSMVMTGAGILLNSVIEEKSTKILEVLLSSASVPEIMGGKILGVAGLTGTVIGVWSLAGTIALMAFAPGLAGDLGAVLMGKGLIFYFAAYLVGGYLMYASLFAGIGAFCESQRDAQTLLGPIMIVMSIPIIFMSQAIRTPDSPILNLLSWIPPFTRS
jgi:ABC-2 type transport system permease protein